MSDPIYFVVERHAGREYAAICHDLLSPHLTRKGGLGLDRKPIEAPTLVYALRLDKLPDGQRWAEWPLSKLYANYCGLRDQGKLPPSNLADPPRKAEPAKRLLGEFWEQPKRTWPDRPAERWGAVGFVVVDGVLEPVPL